MQTKLLNKWILIWLFVAVPLIATFVLRKSFNLGLYGDDWLQLYNLWLSFDVHKTLSYFDIKSYLGAYWPQYFFLSVIRYFFGYQDQTYFAASLILRILATISLFFLSLGLSKSRLTALLATLIFTFSAAGLQTTDWVFNMNTYAGIALFNMSATVYLKIRKLETFFSWYWLAFAILFAFSLAVVPVRMHGAVPFLIMSEIILYFSLEKKSILVVNRFLIARLTLPLILMFLLIRAGSFGSGGDNFPLFSASMAYLKDMLQKDRYDILFYYLGIIGNIVIPDISSIASYFSYPLISSIAFSLVGFFILFALRAKKLFYMALILLNIFWALIGNLLTFWNPNLAFSSVFSISVGFQTILLSLLIFLHIHKTHPRVAATVMIGLLWMISFTFIYWPRSGFLILDSVSRYQTVGAAGFSILLAVILSLMLKNSAEITPSSVKNRLTKSAIFMLSFLILFGWLSINFKASQLYFKSLEANRNLDLSSKTWNTLKKYVPKLEEGAPSAFYFTYDNPTATYMVLTFGFWPHAGLVYGIKEMENTPLPTISYDELLEMVRTGEPLKRVHARKEIPLPLSRVFAFDFRNGQLINITDSVRKKLVDDLSKMPAK